MNENKMAGKLKIKPRPGCENRVRLTSQDLILTLDGKELPPSYKLNLEVDTRGVVRAEIGFYPSEVDVEAQVLASFGVLPEVHTAP